MLTQFYQIAPDGATVVMTSLGVVLADLEASYGAAINRLEAGTEEIMSRKPQSIIQAGVPMISFQGWGFENEVLGKIRKVTDYVAHAGIEVSGVKSILDEIPGGELRAYEVSTMDLGAVRRIGTQLAKDTPDADGIWMTGALMPSVSVIQSLERESGLPVIGSMQVVEWQALRLGGVTDKIDGFGRLLREF